MSRSRIPVLLKSHVLLSALALGGCGAGKADTPAEPGPDGPATPPAAAGPGAGDAGVPVAPGPEPGAPPDPGPGEPPPAPPGAEPTPPPALPPPGAECLDGEATCLGWNRAASCAGGAWREETCGDGAGCYAGRCEPAACSDDCTLGEDGCALWDARAGEFVTPRASGSMHDKARGFEEFIRAESAPNGMLAWVRFDSDALGEQRSWYVGDSSIWTGVWLAAEALEHATTRSIESQARIRAIVQALDVAGHVMGDPGLIVRYVAPAGDARFRRMVEAFDCGGPDRSHLCGLSYGGRSYDVIADPSRDQYVGPMLGYALAYDALSSRDEETRAVIRRNVVEIVQELVRLRTVRVQLVINGADLGTQEVQTRFVIPEPRLMRDGAIVLSADSGDLMDGGAIEGAQEFLPNPATFLRKLSIPLLGGLVPERIPRSSSAMMVASFVRFGMRVTEGAPGYEDVHRELSDLYYANADEWGNAHDWLELARSYPMDDGGCNPRYFGTNIALLPSYGFARFETDPGLRSAMVDEVIGARIWPRVRTHHNALFSFVYGSAAGGLDAEMRTLAEELADFRAPVIRRPAIDLRARYRAREPGCTDELSHAEAVRIGDRIITGFVWQAHPWQLVDSGRAGQTYPGVDYLIAYWMGRHHGFVPDDERHHCLRRR